MHQQIRTLTIIFCVALATYSNVGFTDEDVWAKLKQGGYVVLMRHAIAEKTGDPLLLKVNDCSVQRNLSQEGRRQAKLIGQVFRNQSVPIAEVLSSRYCRTQETAKLVFSQLTTWQPLDLLYALPDEDRDARTEIVTERIGAYAGKDNLIMITHRPNIDALTLELVAMGGFLVLKPDHDGGFDIVGDYTPEGNKTE